MATTTAVTMRSFLGPLLVMVCCSVATTAGQRNYCNSLLTPYTSSNLGNLSKGISDNRDTNVLRDLALMPFLAQTRVPETRGNALARTHIVTWMNASGWDVELDEFEDWTPYGYRHFANVVATLHPGRARRVVMACHYDSKLMYTDRPFVAATDSAVPCALLMDGAFRLHNVFRDIDTSNPNSDITLQFIFFDGEEAFVSWTDQDSLYGSRHLANKWEHTFPDPQFPQRNYLSSIESFILLDLIGTSGTFFMERYPETAHVYSKLKQIEWCLRQQGHLRDIPRTGHHIFSNQRDYTLIEDDHLPFIRRNVPAVHLITSPFPSVWHTTDDNLQALDFDRIEHLARILRVFMVDTLLQPALSA